MFRKLIPALAAPLLLVTACASRGDQDAIQVRTGAEAVSALRAAPDAAADAGTASFEMVMAMTMAGDSLDLVATGGYDTDARRMAMSMDMGALFEGLAGSTGQSLPDGLDGAWEMVADGTTFYMRAPMLSAFSGTDGWLSLSPEDLGSSADALGLGVGAYDPSKLLESLRGVVGEVVAVGSEDVRGVPTTHYTATMDMAKALAEVPEDQRALVEAQLDKLGDAEIPVDVWIDAEDLPRRMTMDMSSMFAALGLGDDAAMPTTMQMTMEFFDYGAPVDIVVPSADEVTPFSEVMGGLGGFGADTDGAAS